MNKEKAILPLGILAFAILYVSFNKGILSIPTNCDVYPNEPDCKCFNGKIKAEIDGQYKCVEAECSKDSDCVRTGCSGTICSSTPMITICEWKPEYLCYQQLTCGCIDGLCKFNEKNNCVGG